ncbi:death-associated protein 1 homolog [Danio rerio]|uniref:Death-associated protein 1 homolog n=1 Tax=Danio rerio TaxID=7955 RepID=DAP1A_DANRE|nr:death-associated protein 1 homolog [Danio rerio]Q9I9N1.1 RecName: Full=Death-associated protein 1 homolog; Short=DAP-1; AltName: Full=Death-associated protein 1A; Short=DAP-1A [Danio rerio]AAF66957.1 Dap1a [Danio rerio]AAH49052.1 Death associated protein 1a [Danio rerio]|eukprot:NP_571647.1 death-associated protein 1 [Danio rerio]
MSSPPKEKTETRAGHLPAVKAGGMRIVQKHQSAIEVPDKKDDKDSTEYETVIPPKLPVVVSGVVTKGDKDFTPAAAQVAHQKPVPSAQKLPAGQHLNQHIHQPRK